MKRRHFFFAPLCWLLSSCQGFGAADQTDAARYGNAADVEYAALLWRDLQRRRLVGAGALRTGEFAGRGPHGRRLRRVDGLLRINGIIAPTLVLSDSATAATAVMARRPDDPRGVDRGDWFWASFDADGTLRNAADGRPLAGRIDASAGRFYCAGCHRAAPGGDGVFSHNRYR